MTDFSENYFEQVVHPTQGPALIPIPLDDKDLPLVWVDGVADLKWPEVYDFDEAIKLVEAVAPYIDWTYKHIVLYKERSCGPVKVKSFLSAMNVPAYARNWFQHVGIVVYPQGVVIAGDTR